MSTFVFHSSNTLPAVERIEAEACGAPVRSRRADLWGVLPVEIFTILCIIFRFFARYKTGVEFARDDFIMVAIVVSL
jgi:hypothetical protein